MPNSSRAAVFLDRDGTIIRQVELLHDPKEVKLLPGSTAAIRLLNLAGLFVVVVTNQPVVARGIASPADVAQVHELLNHRLSRGAAHIDAFYFCPHHPNAMLDEYREVCSCRKPNPGMILGAALEHNLDLQRSVMIGDTTQDVLAGIRAKVSTILVQTGHGGRDPWQYPCSPDLTAPNLLSAVRLWLAKVDG